MAKSEVYGFNRSNMSRYRLQYVPRNIDGLAQDFSNSIAIAMELLQSCTKPSICSCLANLLWLEADRFTSILQAYFSGTVAQRFTIIFTIEQFSHSQGLLWC